MADRKGQKSSDDLLRDAKEGLSTSSWEAPKAEPEPEPLIRPADRIATEAGPGAADSRSEPAEAPSTRPRRVADTDIPSIPMRSSIPQRSAPMPAAPAPVQPSGNPAGRAIGTLMRVIAAVIFGVVLVMWIVIIASFFEDNPDAPTATVAGVVATLIPFGLAVLLFRAGGRIRKAGAPDPSASEASSATGPQQPTTIYAPTVIATSIHKHLESDEKILGQATGVRPGAPAFVAKTWMVPLALAVLGVAALTGGFLVLLILAGVVVRIIKNAAKGNASGGDPTIITVVVTEGRILGFSRKWWVSGPISPLFAYPIADVTDSYIQDSDSPILTIHFADGREISMAISKQAAIEMASALRTAGA